MPLDPRCAAAQFEISVAYDQDLLLPESVSSHAAGCEVCVVFKRDMEMLGHQLSSGVYDKTPDLAGPVLARISPSRQPWWSVAAVVLVGLLVGALVGGIGSRFDSVHAQDLEARFHAASPSVRGLTADVLVVERGWHPDVLERVYVGTLAYNAPEQLAIDLVDTTPYPDGDWPPNDVTLEMSDGDTLMTSSNRCPTAAAPQCLRPPAATAVKDQRPFEDGVLIPLEIVGPGRSLSWWSGIDVVGTPDLDGRATIQLQTTVAGVDLVGAITDRGSWRELHPTDPILLWLDRDTLVPLRVEVFAADSPERELWQLRRGYSDDPKGEPILIIELSDVSSTAADVEVSVPADAPSGGFIDRVVPVPEPELEPGFLAHRSGTWSLPDGGLVNVAAWSDGRSWLMVETTDDWKESHLFGLTLPFVRAVDLGEGSVGYLDPTGAAVAIHGTGVDVLVSGSVSQDVLLNTARSLAITGLEIEDDWDEASVVDFDQLPSGVLGPDIDGWSILGELDGDRIVILMTGGGRRTVQITQMAGTRLDPPAGPDFSTVAVRGTTGRSNTATATLEWVENGLVVQMRSDTVGVEEMLDIADALSPR